MRTASSLTARSDRASAQVTQCRFPRARRGDRLRSKIRWADLLAPRVFWTKSDRPNAPQDL